MQCRALPFRELPHQPSLHLAFHDNFEKVSGFYAHIPKLENAAALASGLHYPQSRRSTVAAILREQNEGWGASGKALENLTRLEAGAVAVVSGQQVGLFGGPAYAFYKAVSAIRIAKDLTEQGIDAVPVFWMATEDHDLDEVRRTAFFRDGKLVRIELPGGVGNSAPVGRIALGDAVREAVNTAGQILGADSEIASVLAETYRP